MSTPVNSEFETPLESPGFLLWQVTNIWQRRQRAALKEINLTHVQFVLLAGLLWLSHEGKPVTQVQLAQYAKTDIMMTSQVARTLQEKGLIERTPHPKDTRANSLSLTAQGYTIALRAVTLVEEVDRHFFAALSQGPTSFVALMQQLVESNSP